MTHEGLYLRVYKNRLPSDLFFLEYYSKEVVYKSLVGTEWRKAKATITVKECDTLIFPEGLARYPDDT